MRKRVATVLVVVIPPKSPRQISRSQKEESNVSLTYFEELGGVGDTDSGGSELDPSSDGGTIVLPTGGGFLSAARYHWLLLHSRLFAALYLLPPWPQGMYKQCAVLQ